MNEFEAWKRYRNDDFGYSESELEVVRKSLIELVALPDKFKHEPPDYDDEHPENFPPPANWVMVR